MDVRGARPERQRGQTEVSVECLPGAYSAVVELSRDADLCRQVAAFFCGDVEIVACPDQVERNARAVELIVDSHCGRLAMEHTLIEPFEGHRQRDRQLMRFFRPIQALVEPRLPLASTFTVHFPEGTWVSKPHTAQQEIADWIIGVGPSLNVGRAGVRGHFRSGVPPEVPVPVTLYRWDWGTGASRLFAAASPGREPLRIERIARAFDDKTAKLNEAAVEWDAVPVLVLENDDVQTSNAWLIQEAMRGTSTSIPPNVVQLDTFGDSYMAWVHRTAGLWVGPDAYIPMVGRAGTAVRFGPSTIE